MAEGTWPETAEELIAAQLRLTASVESQQVTTLPADPLVGGVFVCWDPSDRSYAAAALVRGRRTVAVSAAEGSTGHPYRPGLLALREGPVLEAAVLRLSRAPDVLLVNATGADHPRRAGLATHLGAVLGLPTVGVTDRPLVGVAAEPGPQRGSLAPVVAPDGVTRLATAVRAREGVKPLIVHPAWHTDEPTALTVVLSMTGRARTPEPIRRARQLARRSRTLAGPRTRSVLLRNDRTGGVVEQVQPALTLAQLAIGLPVAHDDHVRRR